MKVLARYSPICRGSLHAIEYKLTTKFGDYLSADVVDAVRGRVHCFIPDNEWPINLVEPIYPCLDVFYSLIMVGPEGQYFGYLLPLKFQEIEVQKRITELIINANQNTSSSELPLVKAGKDTFFLDSCHSFDVSGIANRLDDLYKVPSSEKNINTRDVEDA